MQPLANNRFQVIGSLLVYGMATEVEEVDAAARLAPKIPADFVRCWYREMRKTGEVKFAEPLPRSGPVQITFCSDAQFTKGQCRAPMTHFLNTGLTRVIVTWLVPSGLGSKQITRKWLFQAGNETTCLFINAVALKPKAMAEGALYQSALSIKEGNGAKVFNTPLFPYGTYTLELYADGQLIGKANFEMLVTFGGDVLPIKQSLC